MNTFIVGWDPSGKYVEGDEVNREQARLLAHQRAVVFPVSSDAASRSAVGGLFFRRFGTGGKRLQDHVPHRACQMLLFAIANAPRLMWAARLIPVGEPREAYAGNIRLITDSTQVGASGGMGLPSMDVKHVDFASDAFKKPDDQGGWTIGGELPVNFVGEGYLGLALYGYGAGLAIEWVAVAQGDRELAPQTGLR